MKVPLLVVSAFACVCRAAPNDGVVTKSGAGKLEDYLATMGVGAHHRRSRYI